MRYRSVVLSHAGFARYSPKNNISCHVCERLILEQPIYADNGSKCKQGADKGCCFVIETDLWPDSDWTENRFIKDICNIHICSLRYFVVWSTLDLMIIRQQWLELSIWRQVNLKIRMIHMQTTHELHGRITTCIFTSTVFKEPYCGLICIVSSQISNRLKMNAWYFLCWWLFCFL